MLLPVLNILGHGTPKGTVMGFSRDTVLQHCFLLGLGKREGEERERGRVGGRGANKCLAL